jgi:enoyl-CoA hydratase/carnithine racemase
MGNFTYEIRNGIAWVTFDSGGMNTRSLAAIGDIGTLRAELAAARAKSPLAGVIVKGNSFGLGAGANIGELMNADRKGLEALIDKGHEELFGIEDSPFPWLAVIDGYALAVSTSSPRVTASSRRNDPQSAFPRSA